MRGLFFHGLRRGIELPKRSAVHQLSTVAESNKTVIGRGTQQEEGNIPSISRGPAAAVLERSLPAEAARTLHAWERPCSDQEIYGNRGNHIHACRRLDRFALPRIANSGPRRAVRQRRSRRTVACTSIKAAPRVGNRLASGPKLSSSQAAAQSVRPFTSRATVSRIRASRIRATLDDRFLDLGPEQCPNML
jgi:hypothetical protein